MLIQDRKLQAAGNVFDWLKASGYKNSEIEEIAELVIKHSELEIKLLKINDGNEPIDFENSEEISID